MSPTATTTYTLKATNAAGSTTAAATVTVTTAGDVSTGAISSSLVGGQGNHGVQFIGRFLVAPRLNRRRAVFVLSKIDEILAWERTQDQERDSRFVDLGRYLCEVRAGQYWRMDKLRSFDEF
ncbi:MAG: hypothetical protein WA581_19395 [Candidatus Acidiferrales bacterium]